jgi:hypothetical protein
MSQYVATPGDLKMGMKLPSIKPSAMWSKAWFVDYDNGNNGNSMVNSPEFPMKTLTGALAKMGRGDVVYLRPRPYSGTDPQGILDNAVVPIALQGISIIGSGPQSFDPFDMQLRGAAAGAILTVRAPQISIENLCFNRGNSTTGHIRLESSSTDATKKAWGINIFNCHIRNGNIKATAGGALYADNVWYLNIEKCVFVGNQTAIALFASVDSIQNVRIANCDFLHTAAVGVAGIDCHIFGNVLCNQIRITFCYFPGTVPTGLAGATISRYMTLTGCEKGSVDNCIFAAAAAGTFGAAGNNAIIPTTVVIANNYREDAVANVPIIRT